MVKHALCGIYARVFVRAVFHHLPDRLETLELAYAFTVIQMATNSRN